MILRTKAQRNIFYALAEKRTKGQRNERFIHPDTSEK